MAQENVCRYYKFGHCKFLEKCRFMHISERCQNPECEIKSCNLRHPKICKFFRDYNRCKFGEWCSFDHRNYKSDKDIHEKLENLEKAICEKDDQIKELNDKLKSLEERFIQFKIQTVIVEETEKPEEVKFKCEKCSFETTSEKGLKIHTQRKHTKLESETFPKSCELCEETFTCSRDFRKHMKIHSYKFSNGSDGYKCEECDFMSRSKYTMDVHEGKCRKEDFECGLCESNFENVENLELHLVTCEVYQCGDNECKLRAKTIKEIKNHLQEIHGYPMEVMHLKIDRNNPSEIDSKWHWSGNI